MSGLEPPAQQEFEWSDSIHWPYWADFDTMPDTLGSFDAGPIGAEHHEEWQIGFDVLLTEQTQGVPVNPTTPYSRSSVLASAPCSSSPIPPVAESNVPTLSRRRTPRKALKCPVPECEDLTFTRRFDLHRHTQNKHHGSQAKRFVCYAVGCFNNESPCAFARPDKLTSHIKSTHRRDTTFTHCPVRDCVHGSSTLEKLGVHIQRTHSWDEGARAVLNASPCKVYRCPIWRCKKRHMSVEKFPSHFEREHSFDEANVAIQSLNEDGFFVDQLSEAVGFTISVWCPVCMAGCATIKDFAEHIWSTHLFLASAGGAEHFLRWKSELAQNALSYWKSEVSKATPWDCDLSPRVFRFSSRTKTAKCPACTFSVANFDGRVNSPENDLVRNHHLSLLRPEKEVVRELFPHRFQILRLYPDFATHPIFNDFGVLRDN